MELRATCFKDYKGLLFEFVAAATLNTSNEDNLLGHTRAVAMKGTHKEVNRMTFSNCYKWKGRKSYSFSLALNPNRHVSVLHHMWIPRLPKRISFADEQVAQQLTGLKNCNHQSKIFSEAGTLEILPADSTTLMRGPPPNQDSRSVFARQLAHRRSARPSPQSPNRITKPNQTTNPKNCRGSGFAYSKACSNCGITGHFKKVCSRLEGNKDPQTNATHEEEPGEEYGNTDPSFAFVTTTQEQNIRPNHHIIGHP